MISCAWVCVAAPVVTSAEQQETPVEEEEFELPTLEEVARATGTLRSEPIGGSPWVTCSHAGTDAILSVVNCHKTP